MLIVFKELDVSEVLNIALLERRELDLVLRKDMSLDHRERESDGNRDVSERGRMNNEGVQSKIRWWKGGEEDLVFGLDMKS